jgi:hypothetical protein
MPNRHLILYNKSNEVPKSIVKDYNITIVEDYKGSRPTIAEMISKGQFPCVVCNSDIEFKNPDIIEDMTRLTFDIASGGRRDYQWIKSRNKFQGKQTLDYFLINSIRGSALMADINVPLGTIQVDNMIVAKSLHEELKVLDLTRFITVYHKNHEKFKISGRLNLDIDCVSKDIFQDVRTTPFNYALGSLHYASNVAVIGKIHLIYNLPDWAKRIRYLMGRLRIIMENSLERRVSKMVVRSDKEIQGYRYFLFIYLPIYK